ncbi:hypothetical protein IMSHALPRED_005074 [Imshaugia aleurites]|uniref:Uncharacterized protein n=1 Tax=Imshaugia aleurites TaxID=172621 RepID=A0A8H3J9C2_9LECA|nr:hypothetical protein IMSHALPRED_005074 [Imshaugia aleurites]
MTNPSIRFGNGQVKNNKPAVDPGLSIPNEPNSDCDITLGVPLYTFNTIDDESRLSIYKSYDKKSFVYELFEQGGLLKGGGSDLFLSAEALVPNVTLDYPIYYDVDVKLSQAFLHYNDHLAAADGAVLSQVGSGFVMSTSNLSDNMKVTLFLQLPISVSRIAGGSYQSFAGEWAVGGVQAADRVVSAANEGATADPALDDERDSVAPSERGEATGGAGAPVEGCPDLHPLVQARCVRATAHPGKEDRPIQRDDREAPGQPRGGFGTRACVISDAIGRAAFVLAPGQGHELPHAHPAVGQAARGAERGRTIGDPDASERGATFVSTLDLHEPRPR